VGSALAVRCPRLDRRRQWSRSARAAIPAPSSEHVQPRHRQSGGNRFPAGADRRSAQHLPVGKNVFFSAGVPRNLRVS